MLLYHRAFKHFLQRASKGEETPQKLFATLCMLVQKFRLVQEIMVSPCLWPRGPWHQLPCFSSHCLSRYYGSRVFTVARLVVFKTRAVPYCVSEPRHVVLPTTTGYRATDRALLVFRSITSTLRSASAPSCKR